MGHCSNVFFYGKGSEALAQIAQSEGGFSVPEDIQGQAGRGYLLLCVTPASWLHLCGAERLTIKRTRSKGQFSQLLGSSFISFNLLILDYYHYVKKP